MSFGEQTLSEECFCIFSYMSRRCVEVRQLALSQDPWHTKHLTSLRKMEHDNCWASIKRGDLDRHV